MDEFVILKIENALYRLPRGVLTSHSEFFKDMFSSEFSTGTKQDNKEGSSDSCPIVFEQVLQKDFDRLLSLITDGSRLNTSETNTWHATDWVPVLTLADKWQMPRVKRLALGTLKKTGTPSIKITIGRKFEDKLLIQSGLVDLCTRVEPITENEAKDIGFEAAMKCAAIREKLWIKYFTMEKEGTHRLPTSQTRGFAKVAQLHATEDHPSVLRNEKSPESVHLSIHLIFKSGPLEASLGFGNSKSGKVLAFTCSRVHLAKGGAPRPQAVLVNLAIYKGISPVIASQNLPPTSSEPAMTQLSTAGSEIDDKSVRDNDTSYSEPLAASSHVGDDMSGKAIAAQIINLAMNLTATTPSSAAATVTLPSSRNSQEDRNRQRWGRTPVAANQAQVSGGGFVQPRILTPINDTPSLKERKPELEDDGFADWDRIYLPVNSWRAPYPESEQSARVYSPAYYPPPIVPSQPVEPWRTNKTARTRVQGESQPWETVNRKYFSSWCDEGTAPQPRGPRRPTVAPWPRPVSPELLPKKETHRNSLDDSTFLKNWGVPRRDPSPRRKNLRFTNDTVDNNYRGDFGNGSLYNSDAKDLWATPPRSPSPSPVRSGTIPLVESKGFFIPPLFGNSKGYYLEFHQLLRPGANKLDWDATKDPYEFAYRRDGSHVERLHLETYIESLPATQPPINALCLIMDEVNRYVRVRSWGVNSFVTIEMVLNHIYDQLNMVPTAEDWYDLADGKLYPYRMKAIAAKKRAERREKPRASPLKWGDMLEGKVYFGGIVDFVEKPFHGEDLPTFIVNFEE